MEQKNEGGGCIEFEGEGRKEGEGCGMDNFAFNIDGEMDEIFGIWGYGVTGEKSQFVKTKLRGKSKIR